MYEASLGILKSPRGESDISLTFGPSKSLNALLVV